jgi:hypothetical protein
MTPQYGLKIYNIKIDIKAIEWESVDWIHLVHGRDGWCDPVNTIMSLRVI